MVNKTEDIAVCHKGQWRVHVKRAIEQFIGRKAETATLLSRCSLNFELRGGGFRPRQFQRWAAIAYRMRR